MKGARAGSRKGVGPGWGLGLPHRSSRSPRPQLGPRDSGDRSWPMRKDGVNRKR